MSTQTHATQAPVSFAAQFDAAPVAQVSAWAAPVRGIRMPVPATQLGSIAGVSTMTNSTAANAAKGGEAFEDPV